MWFVRCCSVLYDRFPCKTKAKTKPKTNKAKQKHKQIKNKQSKKQNKTCSIGHVHTLLCRLIVFGYSYNYFFLVNLHVCISR